MGVDNPLLNIIEVLYTTICD